MSARDPTGADIALAKRLWHRREGRFLAFVRQRWEDGSDEARARMLAEAMRQRDVAAGQMDLALTPPPAASE